MNREAKIIYRMTFLFSRSDASWLFFLWGHLNTIIYKIPSNIIEELKQRITEDYNNISSVTYKEEGLNFCNSFIVANKAKN